LIPDWRKYLPREEVMLAEVLQLAAIATTRARRAHRLTTFMSELDSFYV
jgi:hypothetical protein